MEKAPNGADTQMPILQTEGRDPGLSPWQQGLGGRQTSRAPTPHPPKLRYSWAPHLLYTDLPTGPRGWGGGRGPPLWSASWPGVHRSWVGTGSVQVAGGEACPSSSGKVYPSWSLPTWGLSWWRLWFDLTFCFSLKEKVSPLQALLSWSRGQLCRPECRGADLRVKYRYSPDPSEEITTPSTRLAGFCQVPHGARAEPVRPRHRGRIAAPGRANYRVIISSIHRPEPRQLASLQFREGISGNLTSANFWTMKLPSHHSPGGRHSGWAVQVPQQGLCVLSLAPAPGAPWVPGAPGTCESCSMQIHQIHSSPLWMWDPTDQATLFLLSYWASTLGVEALALIWNLQTPGEFADC